MSKELLSLIKRSRRFAAPSDEPPEASEALNRLWGRVETRRWKEWSLVELQQLLHELDGDIAVCEHIKNCHQCQMELLLSVERYGGSRGPWWINLQNDYAGVYLDAPKTEKYEFGSYFTRDEGKALPFVMARLKWAETLIGKQFSAGSTLINILESWDVEQGIPWKTLTQMLDEIAGVKYSYADDSVEKVFAEDSIS